METVVEVLGLIAPAVIAALSVWLMNGLKSVIGLVDRAPALVKRITVILIAYGLSKASGALDVVLPETLEAITLDNLEALMSAGLAMAFHAGDKATAPGNGARLLVFLALFASPAMAACQTGSATVTVVDRARLRVEVSPRTFTGEVNDTITFTAVARDTVTNQLVPAVFRWSSEDSLGVRVDPLTGHATLLRAGTYQILAAVQRITAMIIMREQDDGSWREVFANERQPYYSATGVVPPRLELEVGQTANLCAYFETETSEHYVAPVTWMSSDPTIVTVSDDPMLCPTWARGMPFPSQAMRLPELYRRDARVG